MVAWKIIRLFSSYPLFLSPTSLPPLQSFLPPFLSPFRSSLSHFFTHHDGAQVLANEKASFFVCGVLQQIAEHDASSKAITRSSLRHQFRSFLAQHLVLCHAILPSISNNSSQLLCLTCMPVQLLAAASQPDPHSSKHAQLACFQPGFLAVISSVHNSPYAAKPLAQLLHTIALDFQHLAAAAAALAHDLLCRPHTALHWAARFAHQLLAMETSPPASHPAPSCASALAPSASPLLTPALVSVVVPMLVLQNSAADLALTTLPLLRSVLTRPAVRTSDACTAVSGVQRALLRELSSLLGAVAAMSHPNTAADWHLCVVVLLSLVQTASTSAFVVLQCGAVWCFTWCCVGCVCVCV